MDYNTLGGELTGDPLERVYSEITDAQAADDLNTEYRTQSVDTVPSWKVQEAIDDDEFGSLATKYQDLIGRLLSDGDVAINANILNARFESGNTHDALELLKSVTISRAAELGLGVVREGHVREARASQ